ncbi:MAG: sigma-70 family RNA polymerase sigma factor [Clostridia bacterium]|nr:sigma-70 family RNA polymerase sigma factor [Clostridia bacterium]
MDDKEIIRLFNERNEQAISESDRMYGKYCYSIAYRIVENEDDAKEIVNDTFLKAWNTIPPENPRSLCGFFGMLARSTAIDRLRYNTSLKRTGSRTDIAIAELYECIPQSNYGDIIDKMLLGKALDSFLKSLNKRNRSIFIRRYWYVDSLSEIAKRHSINENSVKAILLRLRRSLKKYLEKEGVEI